MSKLFFASIATALLAGPACDGSSSDKPDTATSVPDATGVDTEIADTVEDTVPPDVGMDATNDTEAPDTVGDIDDTPDQTAPMDSEAADAVADTGPTIDPNGDSDKDGVFDLDEVADGTDPFDPRSTRAWHPEIVGYPRLYAGPADREALLALTTDDGDGAVLWGRIVSESDRTPPEHPDETTFKTNITPSQGHIAEAAAMRGWVQDDISYVVKALNIVAARFPDPTYLNLRSQFNAGDNYNLYESQALVGFCGAWDFARGYADAHPEAIDQLLLDAAKSRLLTRIDYFRTLCFLGGGCRALLRGEANNHSLKSLSALGICAMALPDRADAATDFNEALAAMDHIMQDVQGSAEGGWAENWNYLSYSGDTHLPLFVAWHRHAAGGTWPLRHTGWIMRGDDRVDQIRMVEDFGTNAMLKAVHRSAVYAAQPDGKTPPVDDANPSPLQGGLLAGLYQDGIFRWNWRLPAVNRATGRTLVPSFISLLEAPDAVEPAAPLDMFLADAGFSVFRNNWSSDSLYLYMQHEPDQMRSGGQAHEHADNLSFLLHAFGEPLIIDPGYIDYSNHLLVKYAKDHNVILVDGVGQPFWALDPAIQIPPLGNAYLHAAETRQDQTAIIASTKYFAAEVRRRMVRIGEWGFVMADRVLGAAGKMVTWQLNGYASEKIGGTSYSRRDVDAGVAAVFSWARPNATIDALVVAASGAAVAGDRLEENLNKGGRTEHRCGTFEAPMDEDAGFLTLLVPRPNGADAPALVASRPAPGIMSLSGSRDGATVLAILNVTDAAWSSVDAAGTAVTVAADSLWVKTASGATVWSMATPDIPDVINPFPE